MTAVGGGGGGRSSKSSWKSSSQLGSERALAGAFSPTRLSVSYNSNSMKDTLLQTILYIPT